MPAGTKTLLDALCSQMLPRMQYTEGQRDMLLMQHKVIILFVVLSNIISLF